jgi:hypothetical protein
MTDNTIDIYCRGSVYCSVCAPKDMPIEEVVAQTNSLNPTGLPRQWRHSADTHFSRKKTGSPTPCECDDNPDRIHYLMEC